MAKLESQSGASTLRMVSNTCRAGKKENNATRAPAETPTRKAQMI
jgi:hypothetical protein